MISNQQKIQRYSTLTTRSNVANETELREQQQKIVPIFNFSLF